MSEREVAVVAGGSAGIAWMLREGFSALAGFS